MREMKGKFFFQSNTGIIPFGALLMHFFLVSCVVTKHTERDNFEQEIYFIFQEVQLYLFLDQHEEEGKRLREERINR